MFKPITLVAVGSALVFTACGQLGSAKSVAFSVRSGKPALAAQALTVATGIEVTRVRMVVRNLELEQEGATEAETETEEVNAGPFLLDLQGSALDGGVNQVFEAAVPAGDYDTLKFVIHKAEDVDATKPGFEELAAKNASIVIEGTIDGQAFEFVSSIDEAQEHASPVTIADGANNVTLSIDPTGWFVDAAGNRLDPRESSARGAIEENLKSSIDAFEDDNHNGSDDVDEAEVEG